MDEYDDGPYWAILLMYGSHYMRHTGFRRLMVVNGTPGFLGCHTITSSTTMKEGEEQVFMGYSRSSPVIGKGKVLLKLTFGKVLTLNDVLYVPDI